MPDSDVYDHHLTGWCMVLYAVVPEQAAFGDQLKGVEQVDVQNTAATVVGVDGHLNQLRPAIQSYGGSVKVSLSSSSAGLRVITAPHLVIARATCVCPVINGHGVDHVELAAGLLRLSTALQMLCSVHASLQSVYETCAHCRVTC